MKLSGRIKAIAMAGLALAAVALSSTDAFAAVQWNPQNTVEPVSILSLNGNTYFQFTDNKNNWVRCTSVSMYLEAPTNGNPAHAHTVDASGNTAPPAFSGCSSNLGSATVTCTTSWWIDAASTTSIDVTNVSCSINIGGICTISFSNVTIKGDVWDNATSTLTFNSTQSFSISESGLCDGATSATFTGKLQVGSTQGGVTIT